MLRSLFNHLLKRFPTKQQTSVLPSRINNTLAYSRTSGAAFRNTCHECGLVCEFNVYRRIRFATEKANMDIHDFPIEFQCQQCFQISCLLQSGLTGKPLIPDKPCTCGGTLSRQDPLVCPKCFHKYT
jgi:hypothetical protein